ncbi:hypothetical protein TSUD_77470 [Trifolium subterraneum]|uniref:Uncharacterized protein n=1 Tax=Trifolium subterraneum TaxID=3900 RepID=A0A2Z6MBI6_TRISU|nr:hypothetical protein TSUD_77470 [Trifolium subterraneum]
MGQTQLGWCFIPASDVALLTPGSVQYLSYRLRERDGSRGQAIINISVRLEITTGDGVILFLVCLSIILDTDVCVLFFKFEKVGEATCFVTATTIQKGNNACEAANYQPIILNGNGWLSILVIIGMD